MCTYTILSAIRQSFYSHVIYECLSKEVFKISEAFFVLCSAISYVMGELKRIYILII